MGQQVLGYVALYAVLRRTLAQGVSTGIKGGQNHQSEGEPGPESLIGGNAVQNSISASIGPTSAFARSGERSLLEYVSLILALEIREPPRYA